MADLCAFAQPLAANGAGLAGTVLLAWGAIRVIPSAARAYRVAQTRAELEELRRQMNDPQAPPIGEALAHKLQQQEQALEKMLNEASQALADRRERWTTRHTLAVVLGVVLAAASDLLPLLHAALGCQA